MALWQRIKKKYIDIDSYNSNNISNSNSDVDTLDSDDSNCVYRKFMADHIKKISNHDLFKIFWKSLQKMARY